MNLNTDYLTVFSLVLILEIPLVWYRGLSSATSRLWEAHGLLRVAALVTLANAITHPLVFFGFMGSGRPYLWTTLAGQGFAVVIKTVIYQTTTRMPALPGQRAAPAGVKPATARLSWLGATQLALWSTLVSWQIVPILIFVAYQ